VAELFQSSLAFIVDYSWHPADSVHGIEAPALTFVRKQTRGRARRPQAYRPRQASRKWSRLLFFACESTR
jgi:hypothetical protein